MAQLNSLNKSWHKSNSIDRTGTLNFSILMRREGNWFLCISVLLRNAKYPAELQPMLRIATVLPHEAADAVNECLGSR